MKKSILFTLVIIVYSLTIHAQTFAEIDSTPVRVSYFNAGQTTNKTVLNWKVVCYLQYANFEVQRSTNGFDYTTINTFTADKIRCQSPFNFEEPYVTVPTYYRLKVGNRDGNFSTSKVVIAFGNKKSFEINSLTPNRVQSNTLLSISSAEAGNAEIAIINFQGVIVKRIQTNLSKGNTDIQLNVTDLSKGYYVLKVSNSLANTRITKFIKI